MFCYLMNFQSTTFLSSGSLTTFFYSKRIPHPAMLYTVGMGQVVRNVPRERPFPPPTARADGAAAFGECRVSLRILFYTCSRLPPSGDWWCHLNQNLLHISSRFHYRPRINPSIWVPGMYPQTQTHPQATLIKFWSSHVSLPLKIQKPLGRICNKGKQTWGSFTFSIQLVVMSLIAIYPG